MKKRKEIRMASFVNRSSKLCQKGKVEDGMRIVSEGLEYYSNRIIGSISPYAAMDAGLIITVLRHIADEMEVNNEGAKELAAYLTENFRRPKLEERTKIRRANAR